MILLYRTGRFLCSSCLLALRFVVTSVVDHRLYHQSLYTEFDEFGPDSYDQLVRIRKRARLIERNCWRHHMEGVPEMASDRKKV